MIRYIFSFLVFLSAAGTGAATSTHYSQQQLFKNWALSRCLATAYASQDAVASAGGYLELGNAPIEAYNEGSALIQRFLARGYASQSGGTLHTMECIDLFHSKELNTLAKKYHH